MKKYSLLILLSFLFSCNSPNIGSYQKDPLPENFSYHITKDLSNATLRKNEIYVEISRKLTEGQIATLAEKFYKEKGTQERFYIFYQLENEENSIVAWATSHFDPELKITINGSTKIEDHDMLVNAEKVEGEIIGIFNEKEYTFGTYTVYKKEGKTFVKTVYKDGSSSEDEVVASNFQNGIKLTEKEPNGNNEYYILKNDVLEFYNGKNEMFSIGEKID